MANSVALEGYLHIEGFDNLTRDVFDKRKIREGMRKAGRVVARQAQVNLALARGEDNYPVSRTGTLLNSIAFKLSRSGFLVKIAPYKTSAMKAYYPAYLYYGVKMGGRLKPLAPGQGKGKSNRRGKSIRSAALAARAAGDWRIKPRKNYMSDALQDTQSQVRRILEAAFAQALG